MNENWLPIIKKKNVPRIDWLQFSSGYHIDDSNFLISFPLLAILSCSYPLPCLALFKYAIDVGMVQVDVKKQTKNPEWEIPPF